MSADYYSMLGVPKNASEVQIKDAYRRLVLQFHPDINKDPKASERMREINEAYAVLGDPAKRRQYDMMGPGAFSQRFSEDDIFRNFDMESILRSFGMNMSDMSNFQNMFGFGQQQQRPSAYQQQQLSLNIPLADLERGLNRSFTVQYYKRCSNCNGKGGEPGYKDARCPECNGTGVVRRKSANSAFGFPSFFMITSTCSRCGGAGVIHEKVCHVCRGRGQVLVKEKFRVKVEKEE